MSRLPEPAVGLGVLLAAAAGGVDVLAFTRLGHNFASVATGNMVVIGVSVGRDDLQSAVRAAVGVVAFALGVGLGAAITRRSRSEARWPVQATLACALEWLVLAAVAGIWWATGSHVTGGLQDATLGLAALAMGVQSAAYRPTHLPGVTTTYFTGTLTSLMVSLVHDGRLNRPVAVSLAALLIGAIVSGVVVVHAADWVVVIPLVLVGVVVAAGLVRRRAWGAES